MSKTIKQFNLVCMLNKIYKHLKQYKYVRILILYIITKDKTYFSQLWN